MTIGDAVTFSFAIESGGTTDVEAIIDYRVHYVGANGLRMPKVFKLTRRRLAPGQPAALTRRHRFEHVSIRRIRPGRHTIDIQVNGHILGTVHVDVIDPAPGEH